MATYNPILEVVELRRIRLSAVAPPAMKTAIVLDRPGMCPVVVLPGHPVPDGRSGRYRTLYRVDMASHGLSFSTTMPSNNSAFPFSVEIVFACRVVDPAAIVRSEVHDMTRALTPSLTSTMRDAARLFGPLQTGAAEKSMTKALTEAHRASEVHVSGFSVRVSPMNAGDLVTAAREVAVTELRRDAAQRVVKGGRDALLAQSMALNGGDPTAFLDREQNAQEQQTAASLQALAVLMSSKNELEGFAANKIGESAMRAFFPGVKPAPPRPSIRDRVARRQLAAADSPVVDSHPDTGPSDRPPADSAESPGPERPEAGSAADDRHASRIRGTAWGHPTGEGDA